MKKLIDDETKKLLVKTFCVAFIASMIFGLLCLGPSNFSLKVVNASLFSGVEFVFTIGLFTIIFEPARGSLLLILYATAGFIAGMTWSEFARPPWSMFFTAIAGVLVQRELENSSV